MIVTFSFLPENIIKIIYFGFVDVTLFNYFLDLQNNNKRKAWLEMCEKPCFKTEVLQEILPVVVGLLDFRWENSLEMFKVAKNC